MTTKPDCVNMLRCNQKVLKWLPHQDLEYKKFETISSLRLCFVQYKIKQKYQSEDHTLEHYTMFIGITWLPNSAINEKNEL